MIAMNSLAKEGGLGSPTEPPEIRFEGEVTVHPEKIGVNQITVEDVCLRKLDPKNPSKPATPTYQNGQRTLTGSGHTIGHGG